MKRTVLAACVWAALAPAAAAATSGEIWNSFEFRLPLTPHGGGSPDVLRVASEVRHGPRYPGLGQLQLRVGPLWEVSPAWTFALSGLSALRQSNGTSREEARFEIEPTYRFKWGHWALANRSRLETRWLDSGLSFRLSDQVRATYRPPGWDWAPYGSYEGFYDLAANSFNQSRAQLGVSWLRDSARFDLGYLFRARQVPGGVDHEHVLLTTVYSSPRISPLWPDAVLPGAQEDRGAASAAARNLGPTLAPVEPSASTLYLAD